MIGLLSGVVISVMLRRPSKNLVEETKKELEVIDAVTTAQELKAELGAEKAKNRIKEKYSREIFQLDDEQKKTAKALETNPVALARFLVRAGHSTS